ncbi:hypothetical protein HPB52_023167 [Rhipicephalus sanguineus]|uniref:Uncharacterized protein n=1 Tax=Rhipicephalus sanguineus TaxID=34632 RepID=A0A9D4SY42_RHISA|nr:hypothetical protein HPB52_023167 [Rhipicephalus sanguineus]
MESRSTVFCLQAALGPKLLRALNDIGGSPQVERRRRNSWGTSGIPKLSSNPLVATLAPKLRRAAFNRVKPAAALQG